MNLSEVISQMRPSVVQVSYLAMDLDPEFQQALGGRPFFQQNLGTGFFVNDDADVITAKHVLDGAQNLIQNVPAQRHSVTIGVAVANSEGVNSNFVTFPFDLIDVDDRNDLVLLSLHGNPIKDNRAVSSMIVIDGQPQDSQLRTAVTLFPERPVEGTSVAISGYPLSNTVLITTSGAIASVWGQSDAETMSGTYQRPVDVYIADIQANPGNSGGPVYLVENASVIGVCVRGQLTDVLIGDQSGSPASIPAGIQLRHSAGLTEVTPARYIVELLEKHNRPWSPPHRL